jgi:hypothetical protein
LPKIKDGNSICQTGGDALIWPIPIDYFIFWYETSWIGKIISLAFCPYIEHPK